MRYLADHHISHRTVALLKAQGFDIYRISDVLPPDAEDIQILAYARIEDRSYRCYRRGTYSHSSSSVAVSTSERVALFPPLSLRLFAFGPFPLFPLPFVPCGLQPLA
ncbi:MAG: DUF5615 family PIN-like protein [Candidatus Binatia bacterium]